jgi:hypothetical protein
MSSSYFFQLLLEILSRTLLVLLLLDCWVAQRHLLAKKRWARYLIYISMELSFYAYALFCLVVILVETAFYF